MILNIVVFGSANLAIVIIGALIWSSLLWLTRSKVERLPYGHRPRSQAHTAGPTTFGETFGYTFGFLCALVVGFYLLMGFVAIILP